MRPASSQRGYALLAALVVTALAAVFAAAAVAAVSARQSIVGADVTSARAQAAAKQALARVCLELRRHPAALEGELSSAATTAGGEAWQASWVAADARSRHAVAFRSRTGRRVVRGRAKASLGRAAAARRARPSRHGRGRRRGPSGAAPGDRQRAVHRRLCARQGVAGVREPRPRGRRDPPADVVRGDVWPQAGVHALGGVWSAGEEIHATPEAGAEYPYDTDMDTGDNDVSRFVAPPEASLLITLRDAAVAPGAALHDGTLDLTDLPLSRPPGSAVGGWEDGYVVVATAAEGAELRLVGVRPPGACPIVLVIQGAAALGQPGVPTAFDGALLVLGSLRVADHRFSGAMSSCATSWSRLRSLCNWPPTGA